MSARALVLTYHAIDRGPAPLCIEPALFEAHLDLIAESGVVPVPLDRILEGPVAGGTPEPRVSITFDDGFASVVEAAPLLLERGFPATVFCVAGHLGGVNDWPSQGRTAPRRRLAGAEALAELTRGGLELGSHGMSHAPLTPGGDDFLRREIEDSKAMLEQATGASVRWFAYPYAVPGPARSLELLERTYAGACAGANRAIDAGTDRYRIPRVEAHYLRRPAILRRVLEDSDSYLLLRRLGARLRRTMRRDFVGASV